MPGAIFPMVSESVRRGYVRRREKDARRALSEAASNQQSFIETPLKKARRGDNRIEREAEKRHNASIRRETRKAEAARLNVEMAVSAAIDAFRAEIRLTVRYLDEWTQSDGFVALLPASGDIVDVVRMSPLAAFDALMQTASRALRTITRQNRAAAAKLRQSIAAVHTERRRVRALLAAWERYLAGDEAEAPPPLRYLASRRR